MPPVLRSLRGAPAARRPIATRRCAVRSAPDMEAPVWSLAATKVKSASLSLVKLAMSHWMLRRTLGKACTMLTLAPGTARYTTSVPGWALLKAVGVPDGVGGLEGV